MPDFGSRRGAFPFFGALRLAGSILGIRCGADRAAPIWILPGGFPPDSLLSLLPVGAHRVSRRGCVKRSRGLEGVSRAEFSGSRFSRLVRRVTELFLQLRYETGFKN